MTYPKLRYTIFSVLIFLNIPFAIAIANENHPTTGLLFHTTENSSLQHICKIQGDELHCEMAQTFIRLQVPKDQIAKRSKEIYESIAQESHSKESCDEFSNMRKLIVDIIKTPSKIPSEKRGDFNSWSEEHKKEVLKTMSAGEKVCRNKTRENMQDFRDILLKSELSTCRVGTHTWKEVFQKTHSSTTNTPVWISKDIPSGECGVILLNRFEQVSTGSQSKFWNYQSRKAITNPNGKMLMGGLCKDLDESTYSFNWRSRDIFVDCKRINFSAY